ncbi:hypothetical protein IEQ34_016541 [Dendrobium chrysotoxum]|uniref:Uncharacterized protein n=1 Tax=Dendrobium chrysotoxum TaxID=161865 RepID=A0AAV7GEK8_DENCH|nr:hypothetical protein IEQ34_016541 [Dendrobium chrysotoxum]
MPSKITAFKCKNIYLELCYIYTSTNDSLVIYHFSFYINLVYNDTLSGKICDIRCIIAVVELIFVRGVMIRQICLIITYMEFILHNSSLIKI